MASNALPSSSDRLFALAKDMKKGIHDLEATLQIKTEHRSQLRPGHSGSGRSGGHLSGLPRSQEDGHGGS